MSILFFSFLSIYRYKFCILFIFFLRVFHIFNIFSFYLFVQLISCLLSFSSLLPYVCLTYIMSSFFLFSPSVCCYIWERKAPFTFLSPPLTPPAPPPRLRVSVSKDKSQTSPHVVKRVRNIYILVGSHLSVWLDAVTFCVTLILNLCIKTVNFSGFCVKLC